VTRKGTFRGGDLGFAVTGLFAEYRIRADMSSLSLIIVASNLRIFSQFYSSVLASSRLKSIPSKALSSANGRNPKTQLNNPAYQKRFVYEVKHRRTGKHLRAKSSSNSQRKAQQLREYLYT